MCPAAVLLGRSTKLPFFFSLFCFRFGQFPVRAVYLSSACFSAGCRFRCLFSCPCDLATTDSTADKARAGAPTVADGVDARGEGERKEGSKEKRKHVFAFAASAAEVPVETAEGASSALLSFCQHCSLCPPAPSLHDPRPSATSAQDPARAAQLPIHRRFLHPRLPIDRSLHSFDAETEKSICTSTTQHAPPTGPGHDRPQINATFLRLPSFLLPNSRLYFLTSSLSLTLTTIYIFYWPQRPFASADSHPLATYTRPPA